MDIYVWFVLPLPEVCEVRRSIHYLVQEIEVLGLIKMGRAGTLVIACQNLDFSGANQVVLNIVTGTMHEGNVVILAPVLGPFASRFVEVGAAVRTGKLLDLLKDIRDVFCIICNTIMTAPYVSLQMM